MPKNHSFFLRFIKFSIITFYSLLIIDILFYSDKLTYGCKKTFILPNSHLLLLTFLFAFVFYLIFPKIKLGNKFHNVEIYLVISLSVIFLIIQLNISRNIYFETGWDVELISKTINKIIFNNWEVRFEEYYSYSPNNLFITGLLLIIQKLFLKLNIDGYYGTIIINNVLVSITGIITFLVVRKLTQDFLISFSVWLLFSILIGFSPWITIPYTDTYSILFPILTLYLYISILTSNRKLLLLYLIGFVSVLGFFIKPTTIFVFISVVIIESLKFLKNEKKFPIKKVFVILLTLILSAAPIFIINNYFHDILGAENNKNEAFTAFHFLMVGHNPTTNGVYSYDDVLFSRSISGKNERIKANISVFLDRMRSFGVKGYLRFLRSKALINFNDGTFAWGCEGNFYRKIFENQSQSSLFLRNIYYSSGNLYKYYITFNQAVWYFVIFSNLLFGFVIQNTKKEIIIVLLSTIFLLVFVMLFEARARYLINYLPIFLTGTGLSMFYMGKNEKIILDFLNKLRDKPGSH